MFYTRIPVRYSLVDEDGLLQKATRYLPLIGLIVGGISAVGFLLVSQILPVPVAIIAAMTLAVLMTGAFHEDGFVDTCDGFGGGWTVEQKLSIMKDSRIGTYGGIGLVLSLLLKFFLLFELSVGGGELRVAVAIMLSHLVGRLVPVFVIATSSYVRLDEASKAKPVATGVTAAGVIVAIVITGAFVYFLSGSWVMALASPVLAGILALICRAWFHRHIGGYTGDTLGAAEQTGELAVLGVILATLPLLSELTLL